MGDQPEPGSDAGPDAEPDGGTETTGGDPGRGAGSESGGLLGGLPGSPEQTWLAAFLAGTAALVGGSLVAPRLVYDQFVWRHFFGRMVVDARNARCAARIDGRTEFLFQVPAGQTCFEAFAGAGATAVANEQYTILSEVVYIALLVFFAVGLVLMLRRLDIGNTPSFFYALVPYTVFGSALRVVEDASNVIAASGGGTIFPYPWSVLVVAPTIYFSGAALTAVVLVAAVVAQRRGYVDDYARPTAAVGVLLFAATFAVLAYLAATTPAVGVFPAVLIVTLVVATALSWGVYRGVGRYYPSVLAGTGTMTLVVIWAHAVDGVANVLALDWWHVFGIGEYFPKHPVNQFIVNVTESTLPASITGAIGSAWPFLLVKLVAAVLVVSVFDERAFEENPRYTMLLLVAIVVVGLGPGARDMLRATFGV
jgi:uncharacterized membrane protein